MDAQQLAEQQARAMAQQHRQDNAVHVAAAMANAGSAQTSPMAGQPVNGNPAHPMRGTDGKQNPVPAHHHQNKSSIVPQSLIGALGIHAMFSDPKKEEWEARHRAPSKAKTKTEMKRAGTVDKKIDEEAADEHSWGGVSLWVDPEGMLDHGLGQGVMWYFKFNRFIIGYNILLTAVAAISWLSSVGVGPKLQGGTGVFPGTFYLSTYPSDVYPAYVISVTLMLIATFCLGPGYRLYVENYMTKQRKARDEAAAGGQDINWVEDEYEGRYGRDQFDFVDDEAIDHIEYDVPRSTRYSPTGVALSAVCMAVILVLSGVITFYMQRATRQAGGNVAASVSIAIFVALIGATWEYICGILTRLEYWAYWSDYWKSTCVKVLLFKILNIFAVFLSKRIEFQDDVDDECQLQSLADQFLLLIAFNSLATIGNLLFVICCTDKHAERTHDGWREFILSYEYVELVYRQYILGLGFLVMPMIAIFGVAANLLEYSLDKYRLLRVCNKPGATSSSFRGILAFYFFLSALFIFVSFPNGAVFILAGSFGLASNDQCFVYQ